jgi:flagellar biosynthesis/type III secretory pathway ATPase
MTYLQAQLDTVESAMLMRVAGKVQAISGLTIEAIDLPLPLGSTCRIASHGGRTCMAEVIGLQSERTLLMPLTPMAGISRGDMIETSQPRRASGARNNCSAACSTGWASRSTARGRFRQTDFDDWMARASRRSRVSRSANRSPPASARSTGC